MWTGIGISNIASKSLSRDSGSDRLSRKDNPTMFSAECPHCKHSLNLKEAIVILNGSGYKHFVVVRTPDGREHVAPAEQINPNEVEILSPGASFL
jgi:hypothetical protein